jgi:hypothetical protein
MITILKLAGGIAGVTGAALYADPRQKEAMVA